MFLRILVLLSLCVHAAVVRAAAPVRLPPSERAWHERDEVGDIDPRHELTTESFQIGPYKIGPHIKKDSQAGPSKNMKKGPLKRPVPNKAVEVAFWGDWKLVDAKTNVEIPRTHLYFHHILAYSGKQFMTGCSSERTTWGPDHLPYPYRRFLKPNEMVRVTSLDITALQNEIHEFYVNYTIAYKVHNPLDPAIRVVESFYVMDNYNVPGTGGIGAVHTRTKAFHVPKDGVLISLNGHMHQGGRTLTMRRKDTREALCVSRNEYHASIDCYWDCPDVCPYQPHGWTAQWGTTTCYAELPVRQETEFEMVAEYDNSCKWRSVMAWFFGHYFTGQTEGTLPVQLPNKA